MKKMRGCATALGVALFVSACGGGGGDSGSATPGNPGNPGDPGTSSVFAPTADDLPTAISGDYPDQTTALVLDVNYQSTSIPALPGQYIRFSDGRCLDAAPDPLSYPNNRTTLVSLNRTTFATKTDADVCLPEIKVSVGSVIASFIGSNADMRVRGSSTRDTSQKSFRIRSKKDSVTGLRTAMWFGEDTLQLNKHPYDLTRVRNKLAFDLMKQIPHHQSLRTQFMEIRYTDPVNLLPADSGPTGSMGLYTHVEKFSEGYMTRRGWKVAGANIYKAGSFDFNTHAGFGCNPDGTSNAALEAALELEAGDGKACSSVMQLLNDLDDENVPFANTFNAYFNKNNYLTWLASVILFGNYDTTTQNFALYRSPDNGKFYFLPWDYDGALDFSHQMAAESYAAWGYGAGNWWDSALHRRFMAEPGNIALLQAAVTEIRNKYLTKTAIKTLLDSYKPTVRTYIKQNPDRNYLPGSATEAQWEAEFDRLVNVIDTNYDSFMKSLKDPMPFWFSVFTDPGNNITSLGWEWPTPFHPQGHTITYQVDFLPFLASDTTLPRGQTAFDAPGARTVVTRSTGTATELAVASFPTGAHWVRVLAKDATNGTSTYAFDSVYDTQTRYGVMCKMLPANTDCPGVQ